VVGVDYGTVRIGIAISDPLRSIASPHETLTRGGEPADRAYFLKLSRDEQVSLFVVGLPVHLDGHESGKSTEARKFGAWLAEATGVEVRYFDERFSTREAELALAESGAKFTKKQRKARLDKLAAQIMLTAFLERLASGQPSTSEAPRGLDD
jgi:putative Holliday junction resolvase